MTVPFVKTILPSSYNYSDPIASLVDVHSRGVDGTWLSKRAAAGMFRDVDIKPEKDHSYIHLIAMGDAEYYGLNRNGDGFLKQGRMLDIPNPYDGKTTQVKIHCGNVDTHHTFEKYAKVYRNHINKDPKKAEGDVYKSAHNDAMNRVELLIRVKNAKWADELQKLASGEDIPFSMSCVTDPSYPVLTTDGYKAIVDVRKGDQVLTHKGRWRSVTAINRRKYTGELMCFAVNGLPMPLELTADHPMYAKVFSGSREVAAIKAKAHRYFRDSVTFEKSPPDWVHAAHLDVGDRFIYQPVSQSIPGYGAIDDTRLASIMGYYVAEGSFTYNGEKAAVTQFTCNMNDFAVRRIPQLLSDIYPDITCKIRPHRMAAAALNVDICSTEFSMFLWNYVGRRSHHKYVCNELFNASCECKLAFLGAWLDGDGFVDVKGAHWSTCNRHLALQCRDLLVSCGIPASINRINHVGQLGYHGTGLEYTVNVSHLDLFDLMTWSEKVRTRDINYIPERKKPAVLRACPDGRYAYRIKDVSRRFVTDCVTYNIEVEEDESYCLAGMISHNCKVRYDVCSLCGHKAAKRADYCDHLKNHMGELTKSGTQIGMINDHMTYFDISRVVVPADRIAFGLLKAASDLKSNVSGAELAEQMTLFPPKTAGLLDLPTTDKLAAIGKLADIEKEIAAMAGGEDNAELGRCAMSLDPDTYQKDLTDGEHASIRVSKGNAHNVLGALADAKISLSLKDFLKIIMGKRFDEVGDHLGEAEDMLPGVFSRIMAKPYGMLSDLGDFTLGEGVIPRKARETICRMKGTHSLGPEPVSRRVTITVLRGKSPIKLAKPVDLEKSSGTASSLAERMAIAYAMYKVAFLQRAGIDDGVLVRCAVMQHYV